MSLIEQGSLVAKLRNLAERLPDVVERKTCYDAAELLEELLRKREFKGRARRKDPETAHDAAEEAHASKRCLQVLRCLSGYGHGLTKDGVTNYLRKRDPSIQRDTVSPRFIQLREAGFAELRFGPDGKPLKQPGDSGKGQQLHFITKAGLEYLRAVA